jgi:hypothetical protein
LIPGLFVIVHAETLSDSVSYLKSRNDTPPSNTPVKSLHIVSAELCTTLLQSQSRLSGKLKSQCERLVVANSGAKRCE